MKFTSIQYCIYVEIGIDLFMNSKRNFISEAIDRSGMTIGSLAEILNINRNTIYNWIAKGEDLPNGKLRRIGDAIGHDFFGNKEKAAISNSAEYADKLMRLEVELNANKKEIERLKEDMKDLQLELMKLKL